MSDRQKRLTDKNCQVYDVAMPLLIRPCRAAMVISVMTLMAIVRPAHVSQRAAQTRLITLSISGISPPLRRC